ncbi:CAP domain-containing protein [Deinococcus sp.]|uniref:CAP domain-containing protein n=1 Tax=Deinococcus sp. TaxID=47478 RepID=UPI003C79B314
MMAKQWSGMVGLLALALTACGGGSGGSTPGTVSGNAGGSSSVPVNSISVSGQAPSTEEQKILDDVNAARATAHDCGGAHFAATTALTWNAQLAAAARSHSDDMAHNGYREATAQEPEAPHIGADGSTPQQRITATGYAWQTSGENVAAGYTVGGSNDVVVAWLASPGHCSNIMNPKFREIGVGYVAYKGAKYNSFFTQDFGSK